MLLRASPILFGLVLLLFLIAMGAYLRLFLLPLRRLAPRWGVGLLNRAARFWGVTVMQLGMVITRVRLFRTGFEPEMGRSYMIISNHQSIIDIVVLVWLFRGNHIKFVMKKELQWGIPNVSPATRAARFAFLDREAGGHAAEQPLAEMARVVREEGTGVVIFPEGTRGRDGKVRRFKVGGTGILARHLDLPVVVVTLDGTWRAAQPRQMLRNLPGLEIRVHVEEPGSIEPFRRNAEEALAEVRSLMERRLAEMRAGSSRIPPQEAASG